MPALGVQNYKNFSKIVYPNGLDLDKIYAEQACNFYLRGKNRKTKS